MEIIEERDLFITADLIYIYRERGLHSKTGGKKNKWWLWHRGGKRNIMSINKFTQQIRKKVSKQCNSESLEQLSSSVCASKTCLTLRWPWCCLWEEFYDWLTIIQIFLAYTFWPALRNLESAGKNTLFKR